MTRVNLNRKDDFATKARNSKSGNTLHGREKGFFANDIEQNEPFFKDLNSCKTTKINRRISNDVGLGCASLRVFHPCSGGDAAPWCKGPNNFHELWVKHRNQILQYVIYHMFIEYADVAILE